MGLQEYRRKRDFKVTSEPGPVVRKREIALGEVKLTPGQVVSTFVIQKHAASHLHYDFRLELDGVLKSWAVPKGPSLDPSQKRLAMEVEDHPVDYAKFEGEIPSGEYGAGDVIVWDEGIWASVGDARKGLTKGHLEFDLQGKKLKGRWNLVRTRRSSSGKNQWLLIKRNDAAARAENRYDVTVSEPGSVLTGRLVTPGHTGKDAQDVALIGNGKVKKISAKKITIKKTKTKAVSRSAAPKPSKIARGKTKSKTGKKSRTLRGFQEPALALLEAAVPAGNDWVHEVKFDGYRALTQIESGEVKIFTRSGLDWTDRYGDLPRALARLGVSSAWLDGEIAVVDEEGRTQFHGLQAALKNPKPGVLLYYLFDLLEVDGVDLRELPLETRKERLRKLVEELGEPSLIYSDHFAGTGEVLLKKGCEHGLEGIISKERNAPYRSGRGGSWLKIKCGHEQEFVICGYSLSDKGPGLRSLLLGVYDGKGRKRKLRYVGRVGSGFDRGDMRDLLKRFRPLERKESPFPEDVVFPSGYRRGPPAVVRWLSPELVAQVAFRGWTGENVLRQASFKGLREDKPAEAVKTEVPAMTAPAPPDAKSRRKVEKKPAKRTAAKKAKASSSKSVDSESAGHDAPVKITHPDKVLIPDVPLTKRQLVDYYEAIEPFILPHVKDRPLSLLRCPDGIRAQCFFQKNLTTYHPPQIEIEDVENPKGVTDHLLYLDSIQGIVALAQMNVLEIHTWGAHRKYPLHPDLIVFDLDPGPGVKWSAVVEATLEIRELLKDIGLESFVKVSGGKGFHIHVPIEPRYTWEQVKDFAKTIAQHLERESPKKYVSTVSKAKRPGRIFIDYLRNGYGATSVAPYSLRARAGGVVALPISWEEVKTVRADEFTVAKATARLRKQRRDPWANYFKVKQKLGVLE